jgi:hypothetical protein
MVRPVAPLIGLLFMLWAGDAYAADPPPPAAVCDQSGQDQPSGQEPADAAHHHPDSSWHFGLDGVIFATVDMQGGRRGETQFVSQNWLMVMAHRKVGRSALTLTGMFSAEPLTVGEPGYSEIFQEGEAYRNLQITDHQHPHDLFMQLAASWHVPVGSLFGLTLSGGPVGEPALGPVAFMHRASSSENPTAPLSHHILDSTHISMGVVTVGLDRGPFQIEGSAFRGREPDEHRYDLEFGALDSWSTRVWFRPNREWAFQASHGYLHEPEQLEPGDQRRTNASASWFRERPSGFTAVTLAAGRNDRRYSSVHAVLLEATHQTGRTYVYGRLEALTVETEVLLFPQVVHRPHPGELVDPVRAFTAGAVRDVASLWGTKLGLGADVTCYGVPPLLQPTHGEHPVSYHLFVRARLPARGGRMWNSTMGQPMMGASMTDEDSMPDHDSMPH